MNLRGTHGQIKIWKLLNFFIFHTLFDFIKIKKNDFYSFHGPLSFYKIKYGGEVTRSYRLLHDKRDVYFMKSVDNNVINYDLVQIVLLKQII